MGTMEGDLRGLSGGGGEDLLDNQVREPFGPADGCSHHTQPFVEFAITPQIQWL